MRHQQHIAFVIYIYYSTRAHAKHAASDAQASACQVNCHSPLMLLHAAAALLERRAGGCAVLYEANRRYANAPIFTYGNCIEV
jgi:hypothetical protein